MIDLAALFAAGTAAYNTPRGDELLPHVSDLGACKYDVLCRREGKPRVKRSVKTMLRLQKGLHDEQFVIDRIEAGLNALCPNEGWTINRGLTIHNEITGHTDAVLERFTGPLLGDIERMLFDVKTTAWKGSKYKGYHPWSEDISTGHLLQIAGYALELPKNPDGKHMPVAIAELCRVSNGFIQKGWYFPDEEWIKAQVEAQKEIVLSCTEPGVDPVEMGIAIINLDGLVVGLPPENWSCQYCDNIICPNNKNEDNVEIPT